MPSPITKPRSNVRSRRLSGEQRPMQTEIPVSITSASTDGDTIVLVFDQNVRLSGIPQFLKNGEIAPTAASMSAPNTLVLTYPGGGSEAEMVTVPPNSPDVRNWSGGSVAATTVQL